MRKSGIQLLNRIDRFFARSLVNLGIEKKSLIVLLFHGLVKDEKDLDSGLIKPDYVVSTTFFSKTIAYFLSKGYSFIRPQDIINGLAKNEKYILLTFDDGYFNNSLALPILEQYNVPANFFISSYYVENNKSFWWDVVYREHKKRNRNSNELDAEFALFERTKIKEIEKNLIKQFGEDALKPVGDIDRPFTAGELNEFASHKLVSLGNHTSRHAVLSILEQTEILDEFNTCQVFLNKITNDNLPIISYPMGYYNREIAELSGNFGFKLGFTVNERKNYFPLKTDTINALLLNRFTPLHCKNRYRQLLDYRTDFSIKKGLKKFLIR
jgi:peptidoglycan/xylan/chitin deacetylase (PgdA/CDA1 family)